MELFVAYPFGQCAKRVRFLSDLEDQDFVSNNPPNPWKIREKHSKNEEILAAKESSKSPKPGKGGYGKKQQIHIGIGNAQRRLLKRMVKDKRKMWHKECARDEHERTKRKKEVTSKISKTNVNNHQERK